MGKTNKAWVNALFFVATLVINTLVYCIIDIRSNNACNISRFMVK